MIYQNPLPHIIRGVSKAVRAVKITYGHQGRHILASRPQNQQIVTMDGASVLWECSWDHPLEQMGLRLLQEACHSVSQSVGDGTSTTALLIEALLIHGWKSIQAGKFPGDLQQEWVEWIACDIPRLLQDHITPCATTQDLVPHLDRVLHGDLQAAEVVAEALFAAGSQGALNITPGHGRDVILERKPGYQMQQGVESQESLLHHEALRVFETPLVALVHGYIGKLDQIQPLLEEASAFPHPLLIVSQGCFGEALKTITTNDQKLKISQDTLAEWAALKMDGSQPFDTLGDLAALSGATIFDPAWGFGEWRSEWFGSVQRVVASRSRSTWTAFSDETTLQRLESRVFSLDTLGGPSGDQDRIQRRKAMLTDGYIDIRVGGDTESAQKERMSRVEDAVSAGRAAVMSGIARGCPYSVLSMGVEGALREGLLAPFKHGGDFDTPTEILGVVVKTAVSTAAMILGSAYAITRPCKKM